MSSNKTVGFFSGFPDRRFTDEIAERLGKELSVRRCIVFVTACPMDYQQNDEDSAGMHGMFIEYGIGFDQWNICLAFTVDDMDREYEKVLALGAEIIEPPTKRPWGAVNMSFYDPDNNMVFFRSFPENEQHL